ncbi:MAG TPA: hypothetical protein VHM91_16600 [Verrucomicrobiales bacterium]|jgi:hypothetical protein|nr:hypothetical protein [Verrucomicrobiales bacterium]
MPDDPSDHCPPDTENNTTEAPALRPGPLQHADKADTGCLVMLFVMFIGVFLLPAVFLLGGAPIIIPLILCLLMVLATPFVNPMEGRRSNRSVWTGRVVTFLVLAAIVVAAWYWLLGRKRTDEPFDVRQQGASSLRSASPERGCGWS